MFSSEDALKTHCLFYAINHPAGVFLRKKNRKHPDFLFSEGMLSRIQPCKQAAQRAEQYQTDNEIADAVGHVKEQT